MNEIPEVFTAVSVKSEGTSLIINTEKTNVNDALSSVDAQGSAIGDLALAEPIDDTTVTYIVGGTEARGYEDGQEYPNAKAAGTKKLKQSKHQNPEAVKWSKSDDRMYDFRSYRNLQD